MSGMCCQIDVMRCAINVVLGQKLMPLQGDGSLCVHTQGVALVWQLVGLSGRRWQHTSFIFQWED